MKWVAPSSEFWYIIRAQQPQFGQRTHRHGVEEDNNCGDQQEGDEQPDDHPLVVPPDHVA